MKIKITDTGKVIGVVSDTYKPISLDEARNIGSLTDVQAFVMSEGTVREIVPFEQAPHYAQGTIKYLDPASVIATRQTETPWNRSRSGYGSKLPTSWQVQLTDKRWRRVYVVCWSNCGSAYICTKAGCLYFGSFEPSEFKNS